MTERTHNDAAAGYFEPELSLTVLRGCRKCGCKHPLAFKPVPADTTVCPSCKSPVVEPGETQVEKAVLTGYSPSTFFAKACLSIGKALTNLATRK